MPLSAKQIEQIRSGRRKLFRGKKTEKELQAVEPSTRIQNRFVGVLNQAIEKSRDAVLELYNAVATLPDFEAQIDNAFANMDWWTEVNFEIKNIIDELETYEREEFYDILNKGMGVNVSGFITETGIEDLLDVIVEESVERVTELTEKEKERLHRLTRNSIMSGDDKSLQFRIEMNQTFFKTMKNEAKFVARDMTQRTVNSLNQARQKAAGIRKYKWITSKDGRVRETHAKMDGLEVDWNTGKILPTLLAQKRGVAGKNVKNVAGGHVGAEYNCRCTAKPILEIEKNDSDN